MKLNYTYNTGHDLCIITSPHSHCFRDPSSSSDYHLAKMSINPIITFKAGMCDLDVSV